MKAKKKGKERGGSVEEKESLQHGVVGVEPQSSLVAEAEAEAPELTPPDRQGTRE